MTEAGFKKALGQAKNSKERMIIITDNFNWSGLVTQAEQTVAIYYIAQAIAEILSKSDE